MKLDARTKLALIICSNYFVFSMPSPAIELLFAAFILCLMLFHGEIQTALKVGGFYLALTAIFYFYPSHWVDGASQMIRLMSNYFRLLMLVVLTCTLMVKTTTIRELISALRKLRIPQFVIIPLAITVRYFPSLIQDYQMTTDAIKLRSVKGGYAKVHALYITLLSSALNVSDEITAAAITRGIENPCKKKFMSSLRLSMFDWLVLVTTVILIYLQMGGIL